MLGKAGYHIQQLQPDYDEQLRNLYLEFFKSRSNITIFDVGGYRGESVLRFKNIFPKSTIHSFEPDPSTFEVLKNNTLNFDGVCLNNFGFTSHEGVGSRTFYRNEFSKLSSLLKYNMSGSDISYMLNRIEKEGSIASAERKKLVDGFNQPIKADFTSIDEYVAKNQIDTIDILKMDVQGHEPECLEGAIESLDKIKLIFTELIFTEMYEKSLSFYDVEKFLIPNNFRLYRLFRVSRNKYNQGTSQIDALYVNQDHCDFAS